MTLILLTGCSDLMALSDAIAALTDPLVVQATYIGVETPPAEMPLEGTSWAEGSRAQAILADAGALDNLSEAPIDDATVALELDGVPVPLAAQSAGSFVATAAEGLGWAPGVDATLVIDRDGEHVIALTTPALPLVELGAQYALDEAMVIDLEGQPFDNVVVTVIRVLDGETVYNSLPTDIDGLYRLTHSSGELVTEVPGETFHEAGVYVVGVTGLVNADPDTYVGVNLALSALTAGAVDFSVVTVM